MNKIGRVISLGIVLIASALTRSIAGPSPHGMPLDDRLWVAVFRYQIRHLNAPWVCLKLGGMWASDEGRNVVMHDAARRNPSSAVLRLSLRHGPSSLGGSPVRLVGDGPDLGPHGSETLSIAALRWISPSRALAYGAVRSYPRAGSDSEGSVEFCAYELHANASGWTVTRAKSITGFG